MATKTATPQKKKVLIVIPDYNAKTMGAALVRLGFVRKKSNNHQHKYKHPTLKAHIGNKACVVFPDDIGDRKVLQQVVVKQIAGNFCIPLEEVIAAIK